MIDFEGITKLVEWAEANGSSCSPNLRFEYAAHRGVFATAKEEQTTSEPQLRVPTELILHGGVAEKYFGKQLAVSETNLNGGLKLLWAKLKYGESTMVNGKDLNEFYKSYIALLPEGKATGSVFYWNNDELRLLDNTNLGGSLPAKFQWLVDEWYNTVSDLPESFQSAQTTDDLKFRDDYTSFTRARLLKSLNNVTSWTSFGAYLWSTTIFTSRAFPHRIIDSTAKDGQAMFVPLIDLLNHNNSTVIEWKYDPADNGYFTMHNLDHIEAGGEVFNNYGAKGNEELLMGYGFVIDKNPNDSVALRVKPPFSKVLEAREEGVHIPKIDDYTYHAFATDEPQGDDLTEENYTGLLYFLNNKSLLPENLVELFVSLVKNDNETGKTVRQRLDALQNLRKALEFKFLALKKGFTIDVEDIDPHVVDTAQIYRDGQVGILKNTLIKIKTEEKELLHEYRNHVLSLKKIYKKDPRFREGLSLFGIESYDDLEDEEGDGDAETFYMLWVILHSEIPVLDADEDGEEDVYAAPDWVKEEYEKFKKITSAGEEFELPYRFTQMKQGLVKHPLGKFVTKENLIIADRVVQMNSYKRGSTDDVILVEPLQIEQ